MLPLSEPTPWFNVADSTEVGAGEITPRRNGQQIASEPNGAGFKAS
jgi:hypothetical protein